MDNKIIFNKKDFTDIRINTLVDIIRSCPAKIIDADGDHPILEIRRRWKESWNSLDLIPQVDGDVLVKVNPDPESYCHYVNSSTCRGLVYIYTYPSGKRYGHWLHIVNR